MLIFCNGFCILSAALKYELNLHIVLDKLSFLQATLENNLPSEIVSKINLVDLAGRLVIFFFLFFVQLLKELLTPLIFKF